jgi:hypothetical protein
MKIISTRGRAKQVEQPAANITVSDWTNAYSGPWVIVPAQEIIDINLDAATKEFIDAIRDSLRP